MKLKTEKFKKAYSASTAYAKSYRVDAAAEVDRMKKKADEEILNVLKRTNAEIKKVEDSNNDE
ncbi:MAG: hypothetical protein DRO87_07790 [Candidatus Thorarchaeota archaeon]|nr:MAG: hypothetical protein DRO87_07790 [Candidatus Thorarchaeota archaeon]